MKSNHTPGVLFVGNILGNGNIPIMDNGRGVHCVVALIPFNTTDAGATNHQEANATRIVQTWNAHDDLVRTLRNAIECLVICADDSEEAGYPSRAEAVRADVKTYREVLKQAAARL